jgi:hypothetical protein
VQTAEATIVGSTPACEQEQRHLNAKGLLKQRDNATGLSQATGLDRMAESLARVLGERGKQLVEAMFLQGLSRCHATNLIKTEFETVFTDLQCRKDV